MTGKAIPGIYETEHSRIIPAAAGVRPGAGFRRTGTGKDGNMAAKKPKKKRNVKKVLLIILAVLAGLVLLSMPSLLFPESDVLYYIAYGPLTILWGVFYLFFGVLLLLGILFFINGAHGGYTDGGWKAMGLAVLVSLAVLFGLGFLLTRADFVPFSDKPFEAPLFGDVFGSSAIRSGEYTYRIRRTGSGREARIASWDGDAAELLIPDTLDGCRVTGICDGAFAGKPLRELVLPDGLEEIGERAFYGCRQLGYLILPDSLKTIGKEAFMDCNHLTLISLSKDRQYTYDTSFQSLSWYTLATAGAGKTVTFGRWEQDGSAVNGEEPLEWLVLKTEGDRQLLLCRYLPGRTAYSRNRDGSWENSEMKQWLNGEFAGEAFTAEERARIGGEGVFLLTQDTLDECLPEPETRATRRTLHEMIRSGRIDYAQNSENGMTEWIALDGNGEAVLVDRYGRYETLFRYEGLFYARPAIWVTAAE